jgi:hypothetical protein
VSGLVEQRVKVLSTPVSKTGALTSISDLSFDVTANTKYLCEVGLIVSGTATSTQFSGLVSSTGIAASNSNLLSAYGTWNYNERTASDGKNYSTATPVTGVCLIGSGINNGNMTLVNKFTVQTYVTEADRLTVQFGTNNTDGAILAGSWFKAEKVI